jgi:type IV pilus assembly protein PilC
MAEANEKLRGAGVIATKVEPVKEGTKKKRGKKVPLADMSMFSRQFAAMLDAGIPVTQSLSTLASQTTHQTLANSVRTIAEDVEGGAALSDAFRSQRPVFTDLYCSMVAAGEIGGMLDKTLLAMSNQLHKDKQLKDSIKSATSYPKMVGGMAVVICLVMIIFMVPMFKEMAATVEDINPITQLIYNLSDSLRAHWYFYIVGVVIAIFAMRFIIKSPPVQNFWENHKMKFPLIGELLTKTVLARFCRIFATLLAGGVTAVKALETAGPTSGSKLVANAVSNAIEQIENGRTIHEALDETKMFPPMLISMIAIGEEAGTLPTMLDKVAEFYEEDVTAISKNLGTTLEPLMMLLLGVVVGFLLIALYLPIFQASTAMPS